MGQTQTGLMKYAFVHITSATTTALVPAVPGASITVIALTMSISGAGATAKFQASGDITPPFGVGVYNAGVERQVPLFATAVGQGLNVVTAGTPTVDVLITYYEDTTTG